MPLILPGNVGSATATTGYDVANSCRFNDGSSDTLTRTPSSASNRRTFTISFWVKRSSVDSAHKNVFSSGAYSSTQMTQVFFEATDELIFSDFTSSPSQNFNLTTNRKFRDPSAWYHIFIAVDTTQGTASNRIKIYVNGVQETSFSTESYPSENFDCAINVNQIHTIGNRNGASLFFDGYLSEFVFVDGTAQAHTDVGEFDSDSPTIWKPKDVSGLTFGTNGFYLDFEDSSALGNDAAGSNNFTVNNLTAIDQTTDTCTNNFCTVNALDNYHQQATLSEGNTKITFKGPSSYYAYSTGTFGVANGRWYWETKATSAANHDVYGISGRYVIAYNKGLGVNTDEYGYYNYNGNYTNAATDGSYREVSFPGGNVTWTTNDIIGVALDLDSGTNTVKFYKNNALIGTIDIIAPSSGFYYPAWNQFDNQAEVAQPNFGNPSYSLSSAQSDANGYGSFEYAPPSGYFALCSKNLAEFG